MTGAVLDGTNLKVTNAGTVKLLATIKDGKKTGVDFTQEFTVIVKAADYTKVTEALALIPEDMGRYTEESAAAVQKAKDAGAELVFLPFYYSEAALVLQQAAGINYSPIFFGCDGMDGILDVEGFDADSCEQPDVLKSVYPDFNR